MKSLDGQKIRKIETINSWYANGFLNAYVRGKAYRLPVSTVLSMVNEFVFKSEKKRDYIHLTAIDWEETNRSKR